MQHHTRRRFQLPVFIVATLFLIGVIGPQATPAIAADGKESAPPSVGKATRRAPSVSASRLGYYHGVVPCASCPGIDTWLRFDATKGVTRYKLIERYLEEKNGVFRSSGRVTWSGDGTVARLIAKDEARVLAVGNGRAEFLGDDGKAQGEASLYLLRKQEAYAGNGQQLLVDPSSVKRVGERVRFEGLLNFQHRMDGGHQSMHATVDIDCVSQTYLLPSVAYYTGTFSTGKLLHAEPKNENPPLPFAGKDDVFAQVARRHCAQR
ncbi:MAG: copper resistance protein NlpE [Nitrospiraceae bacterium]